MSETFTLQDVRSKSTDKGGLIVIDSKVYDITAYMSRHPGGDDILAEVLGQDASEAFHEVGHSETAKKQLERLLVGHLHDSPQTETKDKPTLATGIRLFPQGMLGVSAGFLLILLSAIFFQVKMS